MDLLSWRNIYLILLCFALLQEYLTQENNDASPPTAIATTDNSSCARIPTTETDDSLLEDAKYCDYPMLWSMENNTCLFFKDVDCGNRQEPITPCEYFNSNCSKPHGENVSLCTCQTPSDLNFETCLNMSDGDHIWPARRWTPFYIHCMDRRTIPRECSDSEMFNFIDGHCDTKVEFVNQAYNLSLSSDIPEPFRYLIKPHSTVSDIQQTDIVEVTHTPVSTEPNGHWIGSTMLSDSLNFVKQSEQTFRGDSKQSDTLSSTKSSDFRNTLERYMTPMLDASSDVFQSDMKSVTFTEYSAQQSLLETLSFHKVRKYIYRDGVTTVSKKSIAAHGINGNVHFQSQVETLLLSAPSQTSFLSSLSRFNQLNTSSLPIVRTHSFLLLNSSYLRLISPSSASMYHISSPSNTYSYKSLLSSSSLSLTLPVALPSTKNMTSMIKETMLSPAFQHSTHLDTFNFTSSSSEAPSSFSSPFSSLILSSSLHSKFASNDFELSTFVSTTASSYGYPTASSASSSSFTELSSPHNSSELNLLTSSLLPVYSLPLHSKLSSTQSLNSLSSKDGKYESLLTSPSLNTKASAAIVSSSDWLVSVLSPSPVSNLIKGSDFLSSESHWTDSSTDLIGESKRITLSSMSSLILEATVQPEASNNLLYTKSTLYSYLGSNKSSNMLISSDNQLNWSSGEPYTLTSLLSSLSSFSIPPPSSLPLATTSSVLSQESITLLSSSFIENPPLSPTLPSVSEPSESSTRSSMPILSTYSASLKSSRSLLSTMPTKSIQPDSTITVPSPSVPVLDLTEVSSKLLMSSHLFPNTTASVSLSSPSAFQLPKTSISQTLPSIAISSPPLSTLSSAKVSSKLSSSATSSLSPIFPSKEILPSISTTSSSSSISTFSSLAISLSQLSSILSSSAIFPSSSTTKTLSSSAILSSLSTTTTLSSSSKSSSLSTSATILSSSSSKLTPSQILSSSLSTVLSPSAISSSHIPSSSSTPTQSSSMISNSFLSLMGIATHPSIGTSKLSSIIPSPTTSSRSSVQQSEISTALISYSSEIVSSSLSAGEFEKISGEKADSNTSLIVGLSVGVTAALLCVIIIVIIVLRNRTKRNAMSGVRLPPELYISENL